MKDKFVNAECELVINLWDAVSDAVPLSKRLDIAVSIIRAMEEYGIDIADLGSIADEDPLLAKAYAEAGSEEESDSDPDEGDED